MLAINENRGMNIIPCARVNSREPIRKRKSAQNSVLKDSLFKGQDDVDFFFEIMENPPKANDWLKESLKMHNEMIMNID